MNKVLAAILLVAACGSKAPPTTNTTPPVASPATPAPSTVPAPAPAPAPAHAKPQYGTFGFDKAGMDASVAPGNDFYGFANGTWQKTTKIPADKSNYGMFTVLSDQSDERTKDIILSAKGEPGSEARKIADYYQSFMDEDAIEQKGIAPIQAELDQIAKIKDEKALLAAFAANSRHGHSSPFRAAVAQDDRQPDQYIAVLHQGGLGLPDRDMYDAKKPQFEKLRAGYKHYLETLLTMGGIKDAGKRAAAVYALEEKIALTHWTRVQNRDPQKTYNKMTIAELQKAAPGVDWKTWLGAVGFAKETAINVNQP